MWSGVGGEGGMNLWRLDQTHMLEWLVWSVCVCVFVKAEEVLLLLCSSHTAVGGGGGGSGSSQDQAGHVPTGVGVSRPPVCETPTRCEVCMCRKSRPS